MSKLSIIIGVILVAGVFAPASVFAQEDTILPAPGLTPDSPFYFIDDLWKSIRLSFTRSSESKADLRLKFAQEKLAEMREMVEEKKDEALARATARYEEHLARARERLENANIPEDQRARLEERLARVTERYQEALDKIDARATERSVRILERASRETYQHQLRAIQELARERPDSAADISWDALDRWGEHVDELVERGVLTEAERELLEQRLDRLDDLEKLAGRVGRFVERDEQISPEERERLCQKFEETKARVLTRLQEALLDVPAEAQPAIERAIEKVQGFDVACDAVSGVRPTPQGQFPAFGGFPGQGAMIDTWIDYVERVIEESEFLTDEEKELLAGHLQTFRELGEEAEELAEEARRIRELTNEEREELAERFEALRAEVIAALEALIADAPEELKPILERVLVFIRSMQNPFEITVPTSPSVEDIQKQLDEARELRDQLQRDFDNFRDQYQDQLRDRLPSGFTPGFFYFNLIPLID